MNPIANNPEQGLAINFGDEFSKDLTVHKNVRQEVIVATTDKIRLVLISTKEAMLSRREWQTPFGLLISFVITFCTADFKDAMNISKDVWFAVFVSLSIVCFVWFVYAICKLIKHWNSSNLDRIIEQMKQNQV